MTEKQFVGGCKTRSEVDDWRKITFNKNDLDLMYQNLNKDGVVHLNMNPRKQISEWGHTHSMYIDTWKPQGA